MSTLLGRMPSAVGYQPTLADEMGQLQERITSTRGRSITSLRGRVRQGNSGGPAVDGRGRVVTTIFAATVSDGGRSGYGVPDEVVADALGSADSAVDTGPCAR